MPLGVSECALEKFVTLLKNAVSSRGAALISNVKVNVEP